MAGNTRCPTDSSMSSMDSTHTQLVKLCLAPASTDVAVFKSPLHRPPQKKRKVLDEEDYVHQLGKIIERDFFPDLDNLKDKVLFLEARATNDVETLQHLHAKYAGSCRLNTPSITDSPATFDTPEVRSKAGKKKATCDTEEATAGAMVTTPARSEGGEQESQAGSGSTRRISSNKAAEPEQLSLDEFLARNTSEDDESFTQILADQRAKIILKKAWMFDAEAKHNALHAPDLSLTPPPATAAEELQRCRDDAKPQRVENWTYKTFSSIMYVPDENHTNSKQEIIDAAKPPREVVHENTRFASRPFVRTLQQTAVQEASAVQACRKEGKIGVDGRELSKETPRVRGYTFIGEASPCPGVEESPLITWGEVEGTPFMLDPSSTPNPHASGGAPAYTIPKVPYRDVIMHRLNEKANQAQRDKKSKALSAAQSNLVSPLVPNAASASSRSGGGQWASERLSRISPAARRLLSNGLGVRQSTDDSLRASYTPSPSSRTRAGDGPTPGSGSSKRRLTPSLRTSETTTPAPVTATPTTPATPATPTTPGLTDGLLRLPSRDSESSAGKKNSATPKRCTAAHFF